MADELIIPKLGLTMTAGTVTEWVAADGAPVTEGDVLYVLTTDKTTTDVEAEASGILHRGVEVGVTLAPGDVVGWLLAPGEEPPTPTGTASSSPSAAPVGPTTAAARSAASPAGAAASSATTSASASATGGRVVATPLAKRRAEELGVDLRAVVGTGPNGRIVADDVDDAHRRSAPAPATAGTSGSTGTDYDGSATPLALRLADRLGLDPSTLAGTGPRGRLRLDDVLAAVTDGTATSPGRPGPAEAPIGPARGERVPLSPMRRVISERMHASLRDTAQLTLHRDVAVDRLIALRAELKATAGPNDPVPSITDFVVKATARALEAHPMLNSSLEGDEIALHDEIDVGLAVAVPDGLVVPVLRSVDELPLGAIGQLARALAAKARDGRLEPRDTESPTFTVTALGTAGIDHFTPVLNPPNVAILGVGRTRTEVRWVDGEARPAQVMGLSLTIDHRVVDGAPGAEFLAEVADRLDAPLHLLGS